MKPKILFFARDYQALFFPKIIFDSYESIFVTLFKAEKKIIEKDGFKVFACFEEDFDNLDITGINCENYLETSFFADRFFGKFAMDERLFLLKKEIAFWRNILTNLSPIAVVNEVVAVEISEVLAIEAKKEKIRYIGWNNTSFPDKPFYFISNPFNTSLYQSIFDQTPSETSIKYAEQFYSQKDITPFYVKGLKSRLSLIRLWNTVLTLVKSLLTFLLVKTKGINKYLSTYYTPRYKWRDLLIALKSFWGSYDDINRFKGKYELIFYPLHYEPEAAILYMSEFNEDQIALIRNLSKCLNQNQILAVKEHPQQLGLLLTKEFRKLRKRLSNVIFIRGEVPSDWVINNVELIVTQTGTLGWEAIIRNKPVVLLGKNFYDKYPYINNFVSFDDLRHMIRTHSYKIPQKDATIKYIAQMWDYSYAGNPFPYPDLYTEKNINDVKIAIVDFLNKHYSEQ